jgi:hypothetical protein
MVEEVKAKQEEEAVVRDKMINEMHDLKDVHK